MCNFADVNPADVCKKRGKGRDCPTRHWRIKQIFHYDCATKIPEQPGGKMLLRWFFMIREEEVGGLGAAAKLPAAATNFARPSQLPLQ